MGFRKTGILVCLIACAAAYAAKELATKVTNGEELRKFYKLTPEYDPQPSMKDIKIFILDRGFAGVSTKPDADHRYLPENVILKDTWGKPDDKPENKRLGLDDAETHGREMAQTVWAMTGMSETNTPQFFLVNSRGVENTRDAIEFVKSEKQKDKDKVHIILMSMAFESLGDFDGKGFINRWMSDATAMGIIAIVAAGNYHGSVHNSPIRKSDIVDSRDKNRRMITFNNTKDKDYLEFTSRVTEDPSKAAPTLSITLSYNGFTDDDKVGVDRDLDLYLEDEYNNLLKASQYKQEKNEDGKLTQYPREKLEWSGHLVEKRKYKIRVSAKADSAFNPDMDKLRITVVSGRAGRPEGTKIVDAIDFKDASLTNEIMVPADNPTVITVGDRSPFCSIGPKIGNNPKPDLWIPRSDVQFNTGAAPSSTSFAAAIFTGIAASLLAKEPLLTRNQLLKSVGKNVPAIERYLTREQAIAYLPDVAAGVEGKLAKEKVSAILRNGSQMVLVADEFPVGLLSYFENENRPKLAEKLDDFDFYLVARRTNGEIAVSGKVRGPQDPYPWNLNNENPAAFVQIMTEKAYKKIQEQDKNIDITKIWSTPTPDELRKQLQD